MDYWFYMGAILVCQDSWCEACGLILVHYGLTMDIILQKSVWRGVLEVSDRVYGKLSLIQYQYAVIIYMCHIDRFQDSMYAPLFLWLDAITASSLIF